MQKLEEVPNAVASIAEKAPEPSLPASPAEVEHNHTFLEMLYLFLQSLKIRQHISLPLSVSCCPVDCISC